MTPLPQHTCRESGNPRHKGYCPCGRKIIPPAGPDPRTAFDPEFARQFLRGAQKLAGIENGWADLVGDRIQAMNAHYGSSYRTVGMHRLFREIDDETFDMGGWALMIALVIPSLDQHDDDTQLEARQICQTLAALGARGHQLVNELRDLLL